VTKTMEAIYENGLLELAEPIPLQGRARVRVSIELPDPRPDASQSVSQATSSLSVSAEATQQSNLRRQATKMSPENHALYKKVEALREKIGPLDFDVVEALRELRDHA
jgi:predicted DNA-binding antitoxin AbrB/MazE fold protein